jgi:cAMP-dependent protein kinase regulator
MKEHKINPILLQKTERIKDLLDIPCEKRTEKMLLELMSFTKDFKIFENISMSIEHQNICSTMTIHRYKPNEVIVKQGEPGNSFFYILNGTVNVRLTLKIDTGITNEKNKHLNNEDNNFENEKKDEQNENNNNNEKKEEDLNVIKVDKNIGVLKAGQTFGELSLLYGTPRSASIVSVTNSALIKIDKEPFDKYVKNIFENQLQEQIEFLKICPIFHKISQDLLIKLGIRTEVKKYSTGQIILEPDLKCEQIYIIRRGTIKVTKKIKFIKNEKKFMENERKKLRKNNNKKNKNYNNFDDLNTKLQIENDLILEKMSLGPSNEDIENENYINKDLTLETLKIGDIFPSYYTINGINLDVSFIADNPSDIIIVKLTDIQDIIPDTYEFIKKYAKRYPNDEFLRKFYYYNESWNKYKNTLKYNILADSLNRDIIKNNDMRKKMFTRKDMNNIKLPDIFTQKRMKF